ncbi:MAG TPA: hypothetical protein PK888_13800 [Deltaproteobacteria bacterium]|nr:hypothetical protein [Deltaproteobacteria bacterium]
MADEPKLHEFDVEAFAAGTWNGDKYTVEDLQAMVANFQALGETVKPPVKLGHNEKQLKEIMQDGQPALGWVKSLRCVKDKLIATLTQVPDLVYKAIRSGRYKRVSSEIYWNYKQGGKVFDKVFAGLALLGADIPAVSTLADLEAYLSQSMRDASFDRIACHSWEMDEGGNQINSHDKGDTHIMDEKEKKIFTDKIADLESKIAELTPEAAASKTYKAELDSLKKTLSDGKKAAQETDLKAFCEGLVTAGKLTPACRDILTDFGKHSYSEDSGYSIPVSTVIEALKTFEKAVISFDEKGTSDKKKDEGEKHVFTEAEEKAKAYQKENPKASLGEAYKAVFNADKELFDRYMKASTNTGASDEE